MSACPKCSATCAADARFCSRCAAPLLPSTLPATITHAPAPTDPVPPERFSPGQILAGRYRIVALLGAGGMGEVYRADDLTLGQPVALKFLPLGLADDTARLIRFRDEVRVARQVTHPNVCRVHDIGEFESQPFLIMEFIDGEDLASLLKRVGRLPEEKAIEVARQLTGALVAVHEQGLLHRDLKPANVMLDGRGKVRLTDFGVAVLVGTSHDVRSGTPAYQAPEVLAGREVTVASDLFALGLVLYELFTGKKAFPAATREELQKAHASGLPLKPSSHTTGIDPQVEQIILRCLAQDPQERPATAMEVLAALPGGDALQAALASGQIPSPSLVADSGGTGRLPHGTATLLLVLVLVNLILFALLTDRAGLHRQVPLRDPHYLRGKARDLLERLGYPHQPADSVEGILVDRAVRRHELKRVESSEAWQGLATGRPAVMVYWYRHSPTRIVHRVSPNDILGYGIPGMPNQSEPALNPGEVCVLLDGVGNLLEWHARPPFPGENRKSREGYAPLLQAAGLDEMNLRSALPIRDPGVFVNERQAWTGDDPHRPGYPIHVEAGTLNGQPAYFWLGVDVEHEDRASVHEMPTSSGVQFSDLAYTALRMLALTVGTWLAWRHYRSRSSYPAGARTLALVYIGGYLLMWAMMAHHAVHPADEWSILNIVLGLVLLNAVTLAMIYLALEPFVRRNKPTWVIGWNRLLTGRWRDPLVGHEVLLGCLLGVVWATVTPLRRLYLPQWLGIPIYPYTIWMATFTSGPLGPIAAYVWIALFFRLLDFFLFMLIYLGTRRLSIAACVWALFRILEWSSWTTWSLGVLSTTMTIVLVSISLFALIRVGLLCFVVVGFVGELLNDLPTTLDFHAWYASTGIWPLLVVAGLAVFGFLTAASDSRSPAEKSTQYEMGRGPSRG